jgi:hypothetical protein
VVNNTLGHNLTYTKFDAIHKENEGRDFSLSSALVPTCPAGGESWHVLKVHGKSRCQLFRVLKKQTIIVIFYKTNFSDTDCTRNKVSLW